MTTEQTGQIDKAILEVRAEIERASGLHPSYPSAHHGMAVIDEEFIELRAEVYRKRIDLVAARTEAIQLATTAIRFAVDICPKDDD